MTQNARVATFVPVEAEPGAAKLIKTTGAATAAKVLPSAFAADEAGSGGGGISEAPNDGTQYGRKNLGWTPVVTGGGGGIPEAPNDGVQYARQSLGWTPVVVTGSGAPINSPAFTGNPTAPTPAPGDNDTTLATTEFVTAADAAATASAGAWALSMFLALTGGTLSGHLSLPTGPAAANAVRKDYVDAADAALTTAIDGKATPADVAAGDALKVTKAGDTMGGVLKVVDGAVGAPGLAFVSGANYGLYYASTAVNVAVGGQKRFTFGAASSESFVNLVAPNGAAAAPSLSFNGQQTSGFWYASSTVNVSIAGVLKFTFAAALMTSVNPIALPADPASPLHAATKQYVDAVSTAFAAADALKYDKAGGIITGDVSVTKASPMISMDASTGGTTNASFWGKKSGANRWVMEMPNTSAEGGADAGSDWTLLCFSDGGTIKAVMQAARATQIVNFSQIPTSPTPAALDDSLKSATTQFVNSAARLMNNQAGTTYTFVLTDCGKVCTFFNAAAVTVTIPPNSSVAFPVGAQIDLMATGVGQVALAAGAGVTLVSEDSKKKLSKIYSCGTLVKVQAPDTWVLSGSLAA